ncbi:hypothetical protein [Pedobacter nutrimenti]|uniref:hypothetical protein n=1 Tax=Pedobacter nutrimenti TaxID=1241337 RepID=UPI002931B646|nr:hypothetical protein [Pedobacter nutrimenti]
MKTIKIKLYEFSELDKAAQQKALEEWRYINVDSDNWFDFSLEHFHTLCKALGIATDSDKISFSGFYSQGDGSSFDSEIDPVVLAKSIAQGTWEEVASIGRLKLSPCPCRQAVLNLIKAQFIDYTAVTKRPSNGNWVNLEVDFWYDHNQCSNYQHIENQLNLLKQWLTTVIAALNQYLYRCLEDEYEYLCSNQEVQNTIEANNYFFTGEGKPADYILSLSMPNP